MTVKHTPGPWQCWHSAADDEGVGQPKVGTYKVQTKRPVPLFAEMEANARLIAAAPAMFELLRNLERDLTTLGAQGRPVSTIRALLAKVEG